MPAGPLLLDLFRDHFARAQPTQQGSGAGLDKQRWGARMEVALCDEKRSLSQLVLDIYSGTVVDEQLDNGIGFDACSAV